MLFIGGPADGEHRDVMRGQLTIRVAEWSSIDASALYGTDMPVSIKTHLYHRMRICEAEVFAHSSLRDAESVVRQLITGYRSIAINAQNSE